MSRPGKKRGNDAPVAQQITARTGATLQVEFPRTFFLNMVLTWDHYIVNQIHTIIVAIEDDGGLTVTAAMDMMDSDEIGCLISVAERHRY